ncbi:adenylate kinase [Candidatus Pelagibacter sp.]|nr:adenylate kinase [Candidatus Pelagibacter sp.]
MNLIIFGPPGAGKGTQANFFANKLNLYQLSTGDLLRKEIKNKTKLGIEIEKIISEGEFATDSIVNELLNLVIKNPVYRNRIIFDGYPRNISQAKNLNLMLENDNQSIKAIFFLNVNRETIEKRILGRITCEKCNKTFNDYFDKREFDNHECGNDFLKKREDDNKEALIIRYDAYMEKTKPVLDFYSTTNKFHEIDGCDEIQVITTKIQQILNV